MGVAASDPDGAPEVPFNRAAQTGAELARIGEAIHGGHLAADGPFTKVCSEALARRLDSPVLLVHSCTAALEIAALLLDIQPGDEVILPSYTFVSTANAFVLRGAVPVFVDVLDDTLNIDPDRVESAVTDRTRAIVPVHYAGVGCDMKTILGIAGEHGLEVIEDAAQGLAASRDGVPLGTTGRLGALSFHETKNVTCGEGGALIVNDPTLLDRAEIIREKGTDRSRFFRGEVDRYTWTDIGSSFAMSEIAAAFLSAQLEKADELTARRLAIWSRYDDAFADLERDGYLRRPMIPSACRHNAHMYQLRLGDTGRRDALISDLGASGIHAVFHYVPLHSSPAGRRYGRCSGSMDATDAAAGELVRLPIWSELEPETVERVIVAVQGFFGR
ncbi:MAG: dTDP-4-amino-4,6-dideoxygalactose transaminase [Solirubrobacterales bacterium]|nr:dTDP-4-amino-4,6-dideoxygalactose transaminase [Solirubrobacterales bacterium]